MISLKEIKAKIFTTDCKDFICEGLYCSEPIPTRDDRGIIDNYFVYACNQDGTEFSRPLVIFGIYSEKGISAYAKMDDEINMEDKIYTAKAVIEDAELLKTYARYEELYPIVREFSYCDCDKNQKQLLSDYMTALHVISGEVLWDFYHFVAPAFFKWANEQESC